ncbi:hypothetical protein ACIREM_18545 [Streptomyces shenzhenensis]|uniref:hypothetical protein n=1 Tax=Streptomyces shenzhenensis TaxID=943815 RepID=UPI0037F2B386
MTVPERAAGAPAGAPARWGTRRRPPSEATIRRRTDVMLDRLAVGWKTNGIPMPAALPEATALPEAVGVTDAVVIAELPRPARAAGTGPPPGGPV